MHFPGLNTHRYIKISQKLSSTKVVKCCSRDYSVQTLSSLWGFFMFPLRLLLLVQCWFCLGLDLRWAAIIETFEILKVNIKGRKKTRGNLPSIHMKSNINKISLLVYTVIFVAPVSMATSSLNYSTLLVLRFVHLITLFSGIGIPTILFILDNTRLKLMKASL